MINSIKTNYSYFKNTFFLLLICNHICLGQIEIKSGAENIKEYLDLIKEKNVGIVANNGSLIRNGSKYIHLIDSLSFASFSSTSDIALDTRSFSLLLNSFPNELSGSIAS